MATKEPEQSAGTSGNSKRIRLIIDTTEALRAAAQQRARKLAFERRKEVSVSDFMNELLERELREELAEPDADSGRKKPRS